MEKTDIDLSARLREVVRRVSYGNQAAFSRRCSLPTASVSRLLSGEYKMTENYIAKICAGVDYLNPDYLRGESDKMMGDDTEELLRSKDEEIRKLKEEVSTLKWLIKKAMLTELGE